MNSDAGATARSTEREYLYTCVQVDVSDVTEVIREKNVSLSNLEKFRRTGVHGVCMGVWANEKNVSLSNVREKFRRISMYGRKRRT